MNELAIRQENAVAISEDTAELIQAGVSANTLRAYRRALDSLASWLTTESNDAVLAEYITHLHRSGNRRRQSLRWLPRSNGKRRT